MRSHSVTTPGEADVEGEEEEVDVAVEAEALKARVQGKAEAGAGALEMTDEALVVVGDGKRQPLMLVMRWTSQVLEKLVDCNVKKRPYLPVVCCKRTR